MQVYISETTIKYAMPEILMAAAILCLSLVGAFSKVKESFRRVHFLSIIVLFITGYILFKLKNVTHVLFNGSFISDPFAILCKLLVLVFTITVLMVGKKSIEHYGFKIYEFVILLLASSLGMMIFISSHDFILMFVGIELMTLSLYIMIAMRRKHIASAESSLKYFILGVLSTGIILYGISWIYGYTGTLNFETIERFLHLKNNDDVIYVLVGLIFILIGLAFKIAAVPFHNWAPDVYEGTNLPILLYLTTAPKLAVFSVLIRLVTGPFSILSKQWVPIMMVLSIASMIIGGIATLTQRSIRRFIAYSAIGQAGFALMGISLANEQGYVYTVFFLFLYMLSIMGFIIGLLHLSSKGKEVETLDDLNGLGKNRPVVAGCLGFFILSMAGLPPLPGFLPKFLLLETVVRKEMYILAIIAVVYSILAAAYYLILIKSIFFDTPDRENSGLRVGKTSVIDLFYMVCIMLVLISIAVFPNAILSIINNAVSVLIYF